MEIKQIKKASLITAIKTPYQKTGKIDFLAFDKLVKRQIQAGTDGLVICGTTGEGHLMNWEENLSLISHATTSFGKDLLIIGNTGSNSTKEAKQATQEALDSKSLAHACLQINPYYGKTNSGILKHLETSLDIAPCIIYNVPSRTAQDISPNIIEKIALHPNFIGVTMKNNPLPVGQETTTKPLNPDTLKTPHGVISVASNVIPALFRLLIITKKNFIYRTFIELLKRSCASQSKILNFKNNHCFRKIKRI